MATCLCALLDQTDGSVRVANAGHPPLFHIGATEKRVLRRRHGRTRRSAAVHHVRRREVTVEPGDTLVLFTDGLIERRGEPIDERLELFASRAGALGSGEGWCDRLVEAMIGGRRTTMSPSLAVRIDHMRPPELHLEVPAELVTYARSATIPASGSSSRGVGEEDTEAVLLAMGEATGNVAVHAYGRAAADCGSTRTRRRPPRGGRCGRRPVAPAADDEGRGRDHRTDERRRSRSTPASTDEHAFARRVAPTRSADPARTLRNAPVPCGRDVRGLHYPFGVPEEAAASRSAATRAPVEGCGSDPARVPGRDDPRGRGRPVVAQNDEGESPTTDLATATQSIVHVVDRIDDVVDAAADDHDHPRARQPSPVVLPPVPGGRPEPGRQGDGVGAYEQRLVDLHFDPGAVDGKFDEKLRFSVETVEKMLGWERDGAIDQPFVDAISNFQFPSRSCPAAESRSGEIDLDRQVLTVYKGYQVAVTTTTSTGNGKRFCGGNDGCQYAVTPPGRYTFQWHVNGWRDGDLGRLYNPWYFNGGIAVHGYQSVPTHPASHGCAAHPHAHLREPRLLGVRGHGGVRAGDASCHERRSARPGGGTRPAPPPPAPSAPPPRPHPPRRRTRHRPPPHRPPPRRPPPRRPPPRHPPPPLAAAVADPCAVASRR